MISRASSADIRHYVHRKQFHRNSIKKSIALAVTITIIVTSQPAITIPVIVTVMVRVTITL